MTTTRRTSRRLDPDALATLEEERDFLLRSLSDLDAEYAAGDIDDTDYETLKDDYTRRAAAAIRGIDKQRAAFAARPGIRWRQVVIWLAGLALLGGISGSLIARSSGARGDNDEATGGLRESTITLLNQARSLLGQQDRSPDAIDLYTEVLDEQPSNAEALTYRAWLRYRSGEDPDEAIAAWEEALRLDPEATDAAVFGIIARSDLGRYDEAAAALGAIDLAAAPPEVAGLIRQRGIVGGSTASPASISSTSPTRPPASTSCRSVHRRGARGSGLPRQQRPHGRPGRGAEAVRGDHRRRAHEPRSTQPPGADPGPGGELDQAAALLDQAVEANPADPEALLSRASFLAGGDADAHTTACGDLDALAAIADAPQPLVERGEALAASICG